jgi:hypothetical protein
VTATPAAARAFTAPTGLLFNTVRPDRVKDFETFLWYLQGALDRSTDASIRAQAKGWRTFKATETGPNNTVMYVFVFDPASPVVDYGFGRILADAYPDAARLLEIWKLYTASVTGGGTLLNLTPAKPLAPVLPGAVPPGAVPPGAVPPAAPGAGPVPGAKPQTAPPAATPPTATPPAATPPAATTVPAR